MRHLSSYFQLAVCDRLMTSQIRRNFQCGMWLQRAAGRHHGSKTRNPATPRGRSNFLHSTLTGTDVLCGRTVLNLKQFIMQAIIEVLYCTINPALAYAV